MFERVQTVANPLGRHTWLHRLDREECLDNVLGDEVGFVSSAARNPPVKAVGVSLAQSVPNVRSAREPTRLVRDGFDSLVELVGRQAGRE